MNLLIEAKLLHGSELLTQEAHGANLSFKALIENSYLPYLPSNGYVHSEKDHENLFDWKEKADSVATPQVMGTIYHNLLQHNLIPRYDSPENFVMISYGSNIPTYERFIFDLDRQSRDFQTHVVAIDMVEIPEDTIKRLSVGRPYIKGIPGGIDGRSTFQFVQCEEKDYHAEPSKIDMILNYRATLYYYLQLCHRSFPDFIKYAIDSIQKYYYELKDTGCVVVDYSEQYDDPRNGKSSDTNMYTSTGHLILNFWEELGIDELFDVQSIGEGEARVLVLKKKSKSSDINSARVFS